MKDLFGSLTGIVMFILFMLLSFISWALPTVAAVLIVLWILDKL